MTKDLILLGSTGSIGDTTLKIINKNNNKYKIKLLTTNKQIKKIYQQALKYNVKKVVIFDKNNYKKYSLKFKNKKIKVYFNVKEALQDERKKINFGISAISGIDGMEPTLNIIKHVKNLGIANKESIICGWKFISKELKKYNTKFIPLDSEHFSIWSLLQSENKNQVKKIYLTASGGPFLNKPLNKLKNVSAKQAMKHPNWKMGKKISIDSATMMNKVFEIIEAKKIFNLSYKKLSILTHPKSYVHAIIKLKNGLTKIVAHDTNMRIPIFNSLYSSNNFINSKKLNLKILNNLSFKEINYKRFSVIKILNKLPENSSLFETILVSINDKLVELFLANKIKFTDISKKMHNILDLKEFKKYKMIKPRKIYDIIFLNNKIRGKIEFKNKV